jgi:hypothetical protein
MKKEEAQILDKLLLEYHEDIRGEVFLSELEDAGFPTEDIDVEYRGNFLRPFRNDIMSGKAIEMYNDDFKYILFLSRNGIYDVLPEGLSHKQEVLKDSEKSVKQFTGIYKERKKEEAEARAFFKPFENAFFDARVELEKTEKDLLCLKQKHFFNFLSNFWRINTDLPASFQEQIIYILPFAHQIAGDFQLVSSLISKSLNLEVTYQVNYTQEEVSEVSNQLGKNRIGVNCIVGNKTAFNPVVTFEAGLISADKIGDYINNGAIAKYIDELFRYLIPMEFDAKIVWKTTPATVSDLVAKEIGYGYLGYSM